MAALMGVLLLMAAALCWQHGVLVVRGCGGAGQDGDDRTGARVAGEDATGTAQRIRIHSRGGMNRRGGRAALSSMSPAASQCKAAAIRVAAASAARARGGGASRSVASRCERASCQSIISRGMQQQQHQQRGVLEPRRRGEARRGEARARELTDISGFHRASDPGSWKRRMDPAMWGRSVGAGATAAATRGGAWFGFGVGMVTYIAQIECSIRVIVIFIPAQEPTSHAACTHLLQEGVHLTTAQPNTSRSAQQHPPAGGICFTALPETQLRQKSDLTRQHRGEQRTAGDRVNSPIQGRLMKGLL